MINVERSSVFTMSWPVLVVAAVGYAVAGWFVGGWIGAGVGLCFGMGHGVVLGDVGASRQLPDDAQSCIDAVLAHAKATIAPESIRGAAVRDVQLDALIVAVYHGKGIPQPRSYFRVRRADLSVTAEDRRTWWPRGLK